MSKFIYSYRDLKPTFALALRDEANAAGFGGIKTCVLMGEKRSRPRHKEEHIYNYPHSLLLLP